jgi:hypothetical protein
MMRVTKISPRGPIFALILTSFAAACAPPALPGSAALQATAALKARHDAQETPEATPPVAATSSKIQKLDHVTLEGAAQAPKERQRTVTVDLAPVLGKEQKIAVTYDIDAVTKPTTLAQVRKAPKWVTASRLLLGEIGIGRLRASRWSLLEGVGILQTVRNRMDPQVSNPLGVKGVANWPGCGPKGTFQTCIHPKEYLGIATTQALKPLKSTAGDLDLVLQAADRAVAAWVVFDQGLLGDVTDGATSYVHRCGGDAYGQPTTACDGRGRDAKGANPHTGPVVFKGPGQWLAAKGHYTMSILGKIDYAKGHLPTSPKAYTSYLKEATVAGLEKVGGDGVL